MPEKTELKADSSNKAKKMLAWALTERLDTPTSDGTIDLPGYTIIDTLGKGGMGTVYRAKHSDLGRLVALKVFTPKGSDYDLFVERLKREGKLMAELKHPNVLGIYDAAVMDDGTPYLVLEYVNGEDLQKRLEREKRLPIRNALRIAINVSQALSAVHKIGIIHRDIKPANVLLGMNGSVKVTDFGISKDTRSDESATSLTMTGTTVGTADYMSPEQTRNEELTSRSDLYSLGVLLYEMLMGVTPRGNFEPPNKRGVPKSLETLIMRCLQRDRLKRPASADTITNSLQRIYQQVNKRKVNDYKAIFLYLIGSLAAIAAVIFLSIKAENPSRKPKTTPLTYIEESVVGQWIDEKETVKLNMHTNRSFTLEEIFGEEEDTLTGLWETSQHGGYYLRYQSDEVEESLKFSHLYIFSNKLIYTAPSGESVEFSHFDK